MKLCHAVKPGEYVVVLASTCPFCGDPLEDHVEVPDPPYDAPVELDVRAIDNHGQPIEKAA